jgi:hypothetical protein
MRDYSRRVVIADAASQQNRSAWEYRAPTSRRAPRIAFARGPARGPTIARPSSAPAHAPRGPPRWSAHAASPPRPRRMPLRAPRRPASSRRFVPIAPPSTRWARRPEPPARAVHPPRFELACMIPVCEMCRQRGGVPSRMDGTRDHRRDLERKVHYSVRGADGFVRSSSRYFAMSASRPSFARSSFRVSTRASASIASARRIRPERHRPARVTPRRSFCTVTGCAVSQVA